MANFRTTFHQDRTITVWSVYSQTWLRRVSAVVAFRDDRLMTSLPQLERLRIARMAAASGYRPAAYWWAQNAVRAADRAEARRACNGWQPA